MRRLAAALGLSLIAVIVTTGWADASKAQTVITTTKGRPITLDAATCQQIHTWLEGALANDTTGQLHRALVKKGQLAVAETEAGATTNDCTSVVTRHRTTTTVVASKLAAQADCGVGQWTASASEDIWSGPLWLATNYMRWGVCEQLDSSETETWGPECWTDTEIGYGAGQNYCVSYYGGTPYLTEESNFYIYPWSWPWYHKNFDWTSPA